MEHSIAFGPVPSRRLGRSLGINNIFPKVCTYSCAYCQVGRTINMQVGRRVFYEPEKIQQAVQEKVEKVTKAGEHIDYLTFVPDGEPTLDANLGREIDLLKPLGIKIAVISNSSLIFRKDVREELLKADLVSLKIDSAIPRAWQLINRPIESLRLPEILDGALEFAKTYNGKLVTETMLIRHVNHYENQIIEIADFLAEAKPFKAYLSIPIRPPALEWVQAPRANAVNRAYQILKERIDRAEYLIGYEGNEFCSTGHIEQDLLSITAVHPLREDAVDNLLAHAQTGWDVVHKLINEDLIIKEQYEGSTFYLRKMP